MLVGESARLHALELLWANISCLLIINMLIMNSWGLVGVEILWLKWWLFLVKLLKRSSSSFNLLPYPRS
jgi:hypothetical protein